MVLFGALG